MPLGRARLAQSIRPADERIVAAISVEIMMRDGLASQSYKNMREYRAFNSGQMNLKVAK